MNKKAEQTIIETIFLLVDLNANNFRRHMKPFKTHNPINLESWVSSYRNGSMEITIDEIIEIAIQNLKGPDKEIEEIKLSIINLNNLLKVKIKPIIDLAQEMEKIQVKKNITVKEFAEIYNISAESQKNYRGRLHDRLPFHQKVKRGKIVYVVEEVENWFKNQHK